MSGTREKRIAACCRWTSIVREREQEEPRAPILAAPRLAHHRIVAVFDLATPHLFSPQSRSAPRVKRPAYLPDQALHRRVARGEAVVLDQLLEDRRLRPAVV